MVRKNPMKEALKSGRIIFGMYCDTLEPSFVEVMGREGVDFVILDTEHNGFGIDACRSCILAAEVSGITPLIRVFDNNPPLINKALEIGALGIVIPHVDSVGKAKLAVQSTKYPPDGIRGVNPGTRAAGFTTSSNEWDASWKLANQEIVTVLQPLESKEGIENLHDILSIPGIDLVSLGIGDLSQVLGYPMQPNAPSIAEAHSKALRICKDKNVPAYALVSDVEKTKEWVQKGVRTFVLGSDVRLFQRGIRKLVSDMHGIKS